MIIQIVEFVRFDTVRLENRLEKIYNEWKPTKIQLASCKASFTRSIYNFKRRGIKRPSIKRREDHTS